MRWVLIILVVMLTIGCSDKTINQYTTIINAPSQKVKVEVRGWRCGIGDLFNNPIGGWRLPRTEGYQAEVSFQHISGITHSELTDDSSEVTVVLPYGPYRIIVETAFTWPDTFFNVIVPRDSALVLHILQEFGEPSIVLIHIRYNPPQEFPGPDEEWRMLLQLDEQSGCVLDMSSGSVTRKFFLWPDYLSVSYYIRVIRDQRRLWTYEAVSALRRAYANGREQAGYPDSLWILETGYICLD